MDAVTLERGGGVQEGATVATEEKTDEKTIVEMEEGTVGMEEGGGIVEMEEVDIFERKRRQARRGVRSATTAEPPPREMTAARLDTQEAEGPAGGPTKRFEFNLGDTFIVVRDPLTDDDVTCPSVALADTLREWTSRRGRCHGLETLGADGPNYYLGPPFPVGDVILANVGDHRLQRAFVLESHHPKYQLRLEDGTTVATNMQDVWLTSRMRGMAPDRVGPFAKICKEVEVGPS